MKKILIIATVALLSTGAAFACDGKKKECCKKGDKKETVKKEKEKTKDAKTTVSTTKA
jgi:hypothetical protein